MGSGGVGTGEPMATRRAWLAGLGVAVVVLLGARAASTVELLDAELVAAGSPVLQNPSGTVRLEDSRLGRLAPPVFVPEPGAVWQLGSGIGFLALLAGRRRRGTPPDTGCTGAPGRADSVAPRRRML